MGPKLDVSHVRCLDVEILESQDVSGATTGTTVLGSIEICKSQMGPMTTVEA